MFHTWVLQQQIRGILNHVDHSASASNLYTDITCQDVDNILHWHIQKNSKLGYFHDIKMPKDQGTLRLVSAYVWEF